MEREREKKKEKTNDLRQRCSWFEETTMSNRYPTSFRTETRLKKKREREENKIPLSREKKKGG